MSFLNHILNLLNGFRHFLQPFHMRKEFFEFSQKGCPTFRFTLRERYVCSNTFVFSAIGEALTYEVPLEELSKLNNIIDSVILVNHTNCPEFKTLELVAQAYTV